MLSDEIIAEYRDVLHRQKFKFNPKAVKVFIFPVKSFIVTPKEMLEIVTGMGYSGEQGV